MAHPSSEPTDDARPLLVITHVPWEGPHVILDSFPGVVVQTRSPLAESRERPLPDPATIRGAVVMGGPMSVNDTDTLPPLATEIDWLRGALDDGLPLLGICLGAQLIATAAGATVRAGHPEIGVHPITVTAADDQLLAHLSAPAHAMHWHGEQFSLPAGAVALASSAHTAVQAFRIGERAWGMLFHLEVDDALLDIWLAEPTMAAEAECALGPGYREHLRAGLPALRPDQARAVFDEFATFCALPRTDTAAFT